VTASFKFNECFCPESSCPAAIKLINCVLAWQSKKQSFSNSVSLCMCNMWRASQIFFWPMWWIFVVLCVICNQIVPDSIFFFFFLSQCLEWDKYNFRAAFFPKKLYPALMVLVKPRTLEKTACLKPAYLGTLIKFPKSNKHYIHLKWIKLTSDHLPSELM